MIVVNYLYLSKILARPSEIVEAVFRHHEMTKSGLILVHLGLHVSYFRVVYRCPVESVHVQLIDRLIVSSSATPNHH